MSFSWIIGPVNEGMHNVEEFVGNDGGAGDGSGKVEGSVANCCSITHRAVASIDHCTVSKNEPACREYDDYS